MAEQQTSTSPAEQPSSPYGRGIWVSYKINFRTLLRTSLFSFARFCHIMNPSTDFEPFLEFRSIDKSKSPGFEHIYSFCIYLQHLYTSRKTQKLNQDRWKITTLSTYKNTNNTAKHEYLLATAEYGSHVVYMRIERRLQMSNVGNSITSGGSIDPPATNMSTPSVPKWSKLASDEIVFSETPFGIGSDAHVATLKFAPDADMTLARLAILVRCVHRSAARYHLLTQNCYWFVYVTVGALGALYPGRISSAPQDKVKQGHWYGIPADIFYKDNKEAIEEIVEAFHEEWTEFLDEIEETVNNTDSDCYQELWRQKEEERRQKEEEQRKREEAERIAAEKDEEIRRLRALLASPKNPRSEY